MCTLGILLGASERYPLIVAANRDESYARPSTGPELWEGSPRIVAGRDLLAGGSWLGANEHGLVAGLTNLWTQRPPALDRRSRGEIVRSILSCRDLDEARAWCARLRAADYNPFLALCAQHDGQAFWVQSHDDCELHALDPGIHAFGNTPPADRDPKPSDAAHALATALAAAPDDRPLSLVEAFRPVLATHRGDRGPRESICVHGKGGYGTVSASILLLGGTRHYFHAVGAPCVSEFADHSHLFERLAGS